MTLLFSAHPIQLYMAPLWAKTVVKRTHTRWPTLKQFNSFLTLLSYFYYRQTLSWILDMLDLISFPCPNNRVTKMPVTGRERKKSFSNICHLLGNIVSHFSFLISKLYFSFSGLERNISTLLIFKKKNTFLFDFYLLFSCLKFHWFLPLFLLCPFFSLFGCILLFLF